MKKEKEREGRKSFFCFFSRIRKKEFICLNTEETRGRKKTREPTNQGRGKEKGTKGKRLRESVRNGAARGFSVSPLFFLQKQIKTLSLFSLLSSSFQRWRFGR